MTDNLYILLTAFMPLITAMVTLALVRFNRIQRWVGVIGGLITWGSSLIILGQVVDVGVQSYRMGGYIPPYGIVLVADSLSSLFAVMGSTVMVGGAACQQRTTFGSE